MSKNLTKKRKKYGEVPLKKKHKQLKDQMKRPAVLREDWLIAKKNI